MQRLTKFNFRDFFHQESASGIVLLFAAFMALFLANSPIALFYNELLSLKVGAADLGLKLSVSHWIQDGLMVIFFFVVGLEIKRELVVGELSSWKKAALPFYAALGGMLVPAAIYLGVTRENPELWQGWAISSATDIAFALGVLTLMGKRAPLSLKIFLLALAILDDIGAVLIIAFFYSHELSGAALGSAALIYLALLGFNKFKVRQIWPYIALGLLLWYAVLLSGVHATIAGVLLATAIPLRGGSRKSELRIENSPLLFLEKKLHGFVAFFVMPIFALANAGVPILELTVADILNPLPLGIMLGLFLGKQIGIFGASLLAVKLNAAAMPQNASMAQFYGVAVLGGIGFTMSLFIGSLAFANAAHQMDMVRLGVILGSILSAVVGYALLAHYPNKSKAG